MWHNSVCSDKEEINELIIPIWILEDTEDHKRIIVIRVMIQISDKDNCIYIGWFFDCIPCTPLTYNLYTYIIS